MHKLARESIWEYEWRSSIRGSYYYHSESDHLLASSSTVPYSILSSRVFSELNGSSPNWWHLLPASHWAISFSTSVLNFRNKCPFLGNSSFFLWHFNMSQSWNDYNLSFIVFNSALPWRTAQLMSTSTLHRPKRAYPSAKSLNTKEYCVSFLMTSPFAQMSK